MNQPLIIYAHPHKNGHNGEILRNISEFFNSRKMKYDLIDLYKIGFNPVLSESEMKSVPKEVKDLQKRIHLADTLIFVYPTWWGMAPAILKGFFDRVFTAGFAFKYSEKGFPKKLLSKDAIVITTSGAPAFFWALTGNLPKRVIKSILSFCGIRSKVYQIGLCEGKITAKKKKQIDKVVAKALGLAGNL